MIARVLRVDLARGQVDTVIAAYRQHVRPVHARAQGLRHHFVLVNRESGRIEIVGVWDSLESVQAIAETLEPARQRMWREFGQAPDVDLYEVADVLVLET